MLLPALFCVTFLTCLNLGDELPNIGFLGRGYDIVRSNPRPLTEPLDTGFVSPVFDMTSYEQKRMTADRRHIVPDYTDVVDCTACQLSFQSSVITGAKSFKSSFNRQITTEFGFMGGNAFSFRASESYLKTVDETSYRKNILVDTMASCFVYCAELRFPLRPTNLDEAFVEAVRLLPANVTKDKKLREHYLLFLRRFGTHVVTGMRSGSLFWQRFTFTAENYTKAEKDTSNLGIETSAGFAFLGGSFSYQTTQERDTAERFTSFASSRTLHSIAALPPSGQGVYNTTVKWLEDSRKNPMPIDFRLIPIDKLLSKPFFPNDDDIESKSGIVTTLLENGDYCSFIASIYVEKGGAMQVNCGEEAPDIIRPKLTTRSNFGGTYFKADAEGIADVPNHLSGIFDCPDGALRVQIGGGAYQIPSPHFPICNVDHTFLPGYFYFCRQGEVTDPQGAFHGFHTVVNAKEYAGRQNYHWAPGCSSAERDNRSEQRGKYEILVAYYGPEYIYASYTPVPGAYVGGFYLISKQPAYSWPNPATGVTSCPSGYRDQLLFSQTKEHPYYAADTTFPFESYVCLLE